MNQELQQKYQELQQELEQAKNYLIRTEATIEQRQNEIAEARKKLKELTTLDDLNAIESLLSDIDTELEKLVAEAHALFIEDNA